MLFEAVFLGMAVYVKFMDKDALKAKLDSIDADFDDESKIISVHQKVEYTDIEKDGWGDEHEWKVRTGYRASKALVDMSKGQRNALKMAHMLNAVGRYSDNQLENMELAFANGSKRITSDHGQKVELPCSAGEYRAQITADAARYCEENPNCVLSEKIRRYSKRGASWASKEDIEASRYLTFKQNRYALFLGNWPGTNMPCYYKEQRGLLTIAPPRSGKTECHILPNLRRYKGSAIVLDVKGECYSKTAQERAKKFGGKVYKFSLADPENSHCYNPLSFITGDKDDVFEQCGELASILCPIHRGEGAGFDKDGQELLQLVLFYVIVRESPPTMGHVRSILKGDKLPELFADVRTKPEDFEEDIIDLAAYFENLYTGSERHWSAVLSSATSEMKAWGGGKVRSITSTTDWNPEQLRLENGSTLYLCVPHGKISHYASLLRVIIWQHMHLLTSDEMTEYYKKNTDRLLPIVFFLDEFAQLGYMPPLLRAMEVGASAGLKMWLVVQYVEQIKRHYGVDDVGFRKMVGANIYLEPDFESAEEISKRLGNAKDVMSDGLVEPLATPQQIMTEYSGQQFVFVGGGTAPTYLDNVPDWQMQEAKAKTAQPQKKPRYRISANGEYERIG
jgi:type IV secretion system protein VirD4